ncbi:MAG: adenylate/guanylate cyclase domain-containing protein [Chloroflexi bacterium]|nr:adenylate/guanylate cyclase domain-containing protein [Chloroflexota bacterium]
MDSRQPPGLDDADQEEWRRQLTQGSAIRWKRRLRNRIPSNPRCKMCAAPFAGIGSLVMPLFGHARWPKNPKYCSGCYQALRASHGGAEIECSLMFADVRGSTALAERMSSSDFTRLMGRFFDTATSILIDEGAMVDKFVGDEVIGLFIPAMATDAHAEHAVRAARRLVAAMGHDRAEGPWLPIGVGVNSDIAYVGSVGTGLDSEMTAMGDAVNLTARLSSHAGAGEILLPLEAARKAGVAVDDLERRSLELKGKSQPTEVVVLTAGAVHQ